jgi:hypothetical protein
MTSWIPLFQTLVWPILMVSLIIYFRSACSTILRAIAGRIESGASVKAGPGGFELGAVSKEMEKLPSAPQSAAIVEAPAPTDWRHERTEEYKRVDGYMLVHVYRPSVTQSQKHDIFLFLVRHRKRTDGPPQREFDEIAGAEFFFGESWGNEVFPVKNEGGVIGIQTRAWGTFLACCRLKFKDDQRQPVVLFRYVDFHMLQDHPTAK